MAVGDLSGPERYIWAIELPRVVHFPRDRKVRTDFGRVY